MTCMLEDSCRLPSVEGCGACIGTPPNVSSFGVVTTGNGLAIGLVVVAGDTGLPLGRSFLPLPPAAAPPVRGSLNGGTIPAREDLEGKAGTTPIFPPPGRLSVVGGADSSPFSGVRIGIGEVGEHSSIGTGCGSEVFCSITIGGGGGGGDDFIFRCLSCVGDFPRLEDGEGLLFRFPGGLFSFTEAELDSLFFSTASLAARSLEGKTTIIKNV